MSDREAILGRVRAAVLHRASHPGAHAPPALSDGWRTFADRLREVGGTSHGPVGVDELPRLAADLVRGHAPDLRAAAQPELAGALGRSGVVVAAEDALPHGFADVGVAFARGRVACAENGAVAVLGADAPHRSLLVLCRHLVLVVDVTRIVPDLHAAFAALPADALAHHHVTWISGPSKTADIEQSLVYGAHGPLTLDVIGVAGLS